MVFGFGFALAEVNMSEYLNYLSYIIISRTIFSLDFNSDGSNICITVGNKFIRLNVSDPSNIVKMGE
jgi:hypothetical protein